MTFDRQMASWTNMASLSAAMALINLGIAKLFAVGFGHVYRGHITQLWTVMGNLTGSFTIDHVLCEATALIT